MEQLLLELKIIKEEIQLLNKKLEMYEADMQFDNWIPRKKLMTFLNYGETQMAELLKNKSLRVAEIGIRKFIKKDSILKLLESSVK